MNKAGAIAVANMSCIGLICALHLYLFPGGVVHTNLEPHWKFVIDNVIIFSALILAFPAGWIGGLLSPPPGAPWLVVVFVPINAYLWGWAGEAAWRHHNENPHRILSWLAFVLGLLALLLLLVAPFWLVYVLRNPGDWDIAELWIGATVVVLLLFTARSIIRSKWGRVHDGETNATV